MPETKFTDHPSLDRHRRQRTWQILIPFISMVALIALGFFLVVIHPADTGRLWADISTIWLIAIGILLALFIAVFLFGMIYLMSKVPAPVAKYSPRVQDVVRQAGGVSRKIMDGFAKPVMLVEQAGAVIKSLFKW